MEGPVNGIRRRIANAAVSAVAIAAGLAMAGCFRTPGDKAAPAPAETRWKLGSTVAPSAPLAGEAAAYLVRQTERLSGGRIQLQLIEPGTPAAPPDLFVAVGKGVVDAAWSNPSNWVGKFPAAALFAGVPFGPAAEEYLAWLYEGGGWTLWKELYAGGNVYPLPCGLLPPAASDWLRQPIANPEQFRGLKIRATGLAGQVLQKLGAAVLLLDEGEVYTALERGLLDGTQAASPDADEKRGFSRVAKHYYFPGWQRPAGLLELLINLDRWKALGADDQALLESICRDVMVQSLAWGASRQPQALLHIRAEGVEVHSWSPDTLRVLRRTFEEVVREGSAKDAAFGRVWNSLSQFRSAYAPWASLARPSGF
jgi:TRAP-type mannitol/chloroaromatic compound transport system substrate-binding protein